MKPGEEKIIKILMNRDELTREEAQGQVDETISEINSVIANGCSYDEVEEIMSEYLGLEMDYFMELML